MSNIVEFSMIASSDEKMARQIRRFGNLVRRCGANNSAEEGVLTQTQLPFSPYFLNTQKSMQILVWFSFFIAVAECFVIGATGKLSSTVRSVRPTGLLSCCSIADVPTPVPWQFVDLPGRSAFVT